MKTLLGAFVLVAVTLLSASPSLAQQKRISPHETISGVIDGNRVMIIYGRPYSKDPKTGEIRKIWGTLVPWGKLWRTGSDEATLLVIQQPIVIAGTTVPAGCYSLWTIPNEDGTAKFIINKQIGQWGIAPRTPTTVYDEKNDVLRADLKKDAVDKQVDEFTMAIAKNSGGGGIITLTWETTQYSIPFTVQK